MNATARRGRPRHDEHPERRSEHLNVLLLRAAGVPTRDIAAARQVTARTVQLWVRRALGYDTPRSRLARMMMSEEIRL